MGEIVEEHIYPFTRSHTHAKVDIDGISAGNVATEFIAFNSATAKAHYGTSGGGSMYIGSNVSAGGAVDDSSAAAWRIIQSKSSDHIRIERSAPGAGWVPVTIFLLDNGGRIAPRVGTVASSATPAINTDLVDLFTITALTVAITSMSSGLTGTPIDGQYLRIAITGTASRAITWGSSFEASTVALPTTTSSTNRLDVWFIYNAATSKWRCIQVA
jgi:hypothetical protein